MSKKIVLKWTNRFSKETGYVKSICVSERHFVNTDQIEKARNFQYDATCKKALAQLEEFGEAVNNTFEVLYV